MSKSDFEKYLQIQLSIFEKYCTRRSASLNRMKADQCSGLNQSGGKKGGGGKKMGGATNSNQSESAITPVAIFLTSSFKDTSLNGTRLGHNGQPWTFHRHLQD